MDIIQAFDLLLTRRVNNIDTFQEMLNDIIEVVYLILTLNKLILALFERREK